MKLRTFIWIACVINLALMLSIVRQGKQSSETEENVSPVPGVQKEPGESTVRVTRVASSTTNVAASPTASTNSWPPFRWEQVESDDYLRLVENLRGIGCPDDTIRDIVVARVLDDYAETAWEQQKPLQAGFWEMVGKVDDIREMPIPKQTEDRLEKIQADKEATLAAVDKALAKEKKPFRLNSDRWSFLSSEMREQVRDIYEQIEAKRSELEKELEEATDLEAEKELRQSLKGLNTARNAAIKTVIGEENWARYDATRNRSANWIRALPGLDATQEEMQQIAAARETLERERPPRPRDATPEELEEYRTASDDINQRQNKLLVEVLGEERAGHVNRAADGDYIDMRNVARRHGLSMDVANRAYEVKTSARTQLENLVAQDIDDERRLKATAALLITVKAELAGIYGEQAWPSYEKYGMGWFEELSSAAEKKEEK